jgi:hypothetical protein
MIGFLYADRAGRSLGVGVGFGGGFPFFISLLRMKVILPDAVPFQKTANVMRHCISEREKRL